MKEILDHYKAEYMHEIELEFQEKATPHYNEYI